MMHSQSNRYNTNFDLYRYSMNGSGFHKSCEGSNSNSKAACVCCSVLRVHSMQVMGVCVSDYVCSSELWSHSHWHCGHAKHLLTFMEKVRCMVRSTAANAPEVLPTIRGTLTKQAHALKCGIMSVTQPLENVIVHTKK